MSSRDPKDVLTAAKAAREQLDILIQTLESNPEAGYGAIQHANKKAVLKTARDVSRVVQTPAENLIEQVMGSYDFAALQAALRLGVFPLLGEPDGDGVSDIEVSKKLDKSHDHIHRILKLLAANDIVEETSPGHFRRREIAQWMLHPVIGSFAMGMISKLGHTIPTIGNWLEESPHPTETFACPLTRVMGKKFWDILAEDPDEAARFGRGMEGLSNMDASVPVIKNWLLKNGRTEGVFKDVGGGSGWLDERLAADFPNISFEIQDIDPRQWSARSSSLSAELQSRITYKQHSFFLPQDPDNESGLIAILQRWIMHDWADVDAVKIIRGIVPALERNPDAAYLINDNVLPELGEWDPFYERSARQFDLVMMSYFNSKERSREMWEKLVKEADERLEIVGITREDGGMAATALIEVRLRR